MNTCHPPAGAGPWEVEEDIVPSYEPLALSQSGQAILNGIINCSRDMIGIWVAGMAFCDLTPVY